MPAVALVVGGCRSSARAEPNLATLSIARDAARFSIVAFSDSTVTFRPAEVRWLRSGMRGHVVDPSQRDALIARLTLLRIDSAGTVATIVGGVSPVAQTHVVLFEQPRRAWYRDRKFWLGALTGGVLGAVAAGAAK